MREIKFGAWHKAEKRMILPVIEINNGFMPFIGWYDTVLDASENSITTAFLDEVVLVEFTGRNDRNGKEIYEGNIARNKHGAIGVIKFHKSWASFYFSTVFGSNEYGDLVPMTSSVPLWNDWETLEIIGNIHEHPHLLEGWNHGA